MPDSTVSVATLKARLSDYLRRVRAGETFVVTDRGVPVARVAPMEGAASLRGRAEELAAAGLLRPPTTSMDASFADANRPSDAEGRSLESVLDERAEGL